MFRKMSQKSFVFMVAAFMVLGAPAIALACNWGAKAEGDCNQLSVTVNIARGSEEAAGTYDLYWAKEGSAKKGQIIASGEVPALKSGEVHKVVYNPKDNKNGNEGNYIFHLKEPRGSIWSNQVNVQGCKNQDDNNRQNPGTPGNGDTPDKGQNPGTPENGDIPDKGQNPGTPENGDTPEKPGNPHSPANGDQPVAEKPNNGSGGKMPKTATNYPIAMALGSSLLLAGVSLFFFRRHTA
ncbi:LPXTG cell wall anchor domain-containing protein [Laceyella putida]|uniref:LPXTG cell wall anchor domain-containing protein n=1 Tax=Laceyella putida TaxID=110101 RepID=A0ABW2RGW8_9BACL